MNLSKTELYSIAVNETVDLDFRWAALKQMKTFIEPIPETTQITTIEPDIQRILNKTTWRRQENRRKKLYAL